MVTVEAVEAASGVVTEVVAVVVAVVVAAFAAVTEVSFSIVFESQVRQC